ncbi:hypothetical protein ERJ75_000745100 [Trypanosoma vivax]|uniref:ADP-ribosylation factor n=1 Tax=Trypanosoma vivax (strain Y486) TaxID=1055687 RepID=G0TYU1_TRYVY|nr:hypothetical protein TRVL_08638 [Trypanosoma vivax]KAH8614241.1 hypothetical protein ERJ75_000745100 [Trypanosoma vivax]CCC49141.1 conserved hypothetical protein [Trypanosoma vivax Y486]
MSGSLTMYVLGPPSSGKTSLLNQIQSINNDGCLLTRPSHDAPTKGQVVHILTLQSPENENVYCTAELRELGGEMTSMWEKFIKGKINSAQTSGRGRYALMFVVDALAPHMLPISSIMLARLKGCDGVCRDWPLVVLLNKVVARNTLTEEEVRFFLLTPGLEGVRILSVDSWNGLGLADAMAWIRSVAFSD